MLKFMCFRRRWKWSDTFVMVVDGGSTTRIGANNILALRRTIFADLVKQVLLPLIGETWRC